MPKTSHVTPAHLKEHKKTRSLLTKPQEEWKPDETAWQVDIDPKKPLPPGFTRWAKQYPSRLEYMYYPPDFSTYVKSPKQAWEFVNAKNVNRRQLRENKPEYNENLAKSRGATVGIFDAIRQEKFSERNGILPPSDDESDDESDDDDGGDDRARKRARSAVAEVVAEHEIQAQLADDLAPAPTVRMVPPLYGPPPTSGEEKRNESDDESESSKNTPLFLGLPYRLVPLEEQLREQADKMERDIADMRRMLWDQRNADNAAAVREDHIFMPEVCNGQLILTSDQSKFMCDLVHHIDYIATCKAYGYKAEGVMLRHPWDPLVTEVDLSTSEIDFNLSKLSPTFYNHIYAHHVVYPARRVAAREAAAERDMQLRAMQLDATARKLWEQQNAQNANAMRENGVFVPSVHNGKLSVSSDHIRAMSDALEGIDVVASFKAYGYREERGVLRHSWDPLAKNVNLRATEFDFDLTRASVSFYNHLYVNHVLELAQATRTPFAAEAAEAGGYNQAHEVVAQLVSHDTDQIGPAGNRIALPPPRADGVDGPLEPAPDRNDGDDDGDDDEVTCEELFGPEE